MSVFADPDIYRIVLESMQTGLYMVDRDQRIQFWNEGAEVITGYFRQDVVGHFCRDFFPPQKDDGKNGICEIGGALASVLGDGRPAIAEVTLRHKAGHQVLVRIRAVPIRDADPWAFEADRRHRKLASYGCLDVATGVLTSSYIQTHLRESLTTFVEHNIPFSILCFQFDALGRFKRTYGTGALNGALRVVAQTVEGNLRPTDFVGHSGGSSFLAILTECNPFELSRATERVKKTVNSTKIKWWGDELPVDVTFGGTTVEVGDDEKSIIERAEKALANSVALVEIG
jgi:diguanylate cyclase (GGDEF)-like protein/PAS domain S-box-containing protein